MSINQELEQLFANWKQASEKKGDSKFFCKDGLVCKPRVIENLWLNANRRVLFLLKDQNQDADSDKHWDDDARCWFNNDKIYEIPFFKNLAYCLYAILNPEKSFETIAQENIIEFSDNTPFAYVEAKKQPGKGSISENELKRYLENYKDFLKEEISILNPDVIVNCCGDPVGWDFVNSEIFSNSPNKHCYRNEFDSKKRATVIYYKDVNKLHIMLPHPSTPSIKNNPKNFFDFVMYPYKDFLKEYPDWLK
ncbi:MAG: hypothetical protein LBJ63_07790 [Prevotellaceae bacterium]|jgi:hypothetical protein|nr:hypothetical protein [Prevotellaceae bacterium]